MPVSLQIPICHVPCGSGNGIAATLGVWNEETAIHAIVKGHLRSMDAATVRRASESKPLLAVLSVQYGVSSTKDTICHITYMYINKVCHCLQLSSTLASSFPHSAPPARFCQQAFLQQQHMQGF